MNKEPQFILEESFVSENQPDPELFRQALAAWLAQVLRR